MPNMKRLLLIFALAGCFIPAAPGASTSFSLGGYHANRNMRQWAAESGAPLPSTHVTVNFGHPATYGKALMYLPSCCTEGWTHHAIQGLFFHELGHVFDSVNMTAARRAEFRQIVGIPPNWNWWRPYPSVRYVVSPNYIIKISPGEMFAEEYAACSLGLTQRGYQDAGYNSYGWLPPLGTDTQLCALIDSA